jgi:hypothetical protein
MRPAISVLNADGRTLIAASRQLCADAGAARRRSRALRADLAALMDEYELAARPPASSGLGHVPAVEEYQPGTWRCAETLIDEHGRWACHVAYKCAAERAQGDDVTGEAFWSDVINAIRDMQSRPACLALQTGWSDFR